MMPGKEANSDILGICFFFVFYTILYVECTHKNILDEVILMSTHNMQFRDKIIIEKKHYILVFLSYRKNFVGTQKRVRISHGKRVISVQIIEVFLYM